MTRLVALVSFAALIGLGEYRVRARGDARRRLSRNDTSAVSSHLEFS